MPVIPSSIGEQIILKMIAVLNAPVPKPAMCWRSRVEAFASRELPAFVLYNLKEPVERISRDQLARTRRVRLECLVASPPPADAAVDPLYVFAIQMLLADPTLGGMVRSVAEAEIVWDVESGYQQVAVAGIEFEVEYSTTLDPTVMP